MKLDDSEPLTGENLKLLCAEVFPAANYDERQGDNNQERWDDAAKHLYTFNVGSLRKLLLSKMDAVMKEDARTVESSLPYVTDDEFVIAEMMKTGVDRATAIGMLDKNLDADALHRRERIKSGVGYTHLGLMRYAVCEFVPVVYVAAN